MVTFSAAVSSFTKSETWYGAWQLMQDIRQCHVQLSVVSCGAAMSGCEKATSSWPAALELIAHMQSHGLSLNVITLSASISACQKSARWRPAAELLAGVRATALQADLPMQNAVTFACARGGCWNRALCCLDSYHCRLLQPNTATYNSALAAFETTGWQEASFILGKMKSSTLKEDAITHTSVSNVLEKVVQWRRSLHRLRAMHVESPCAGKMESLLSLNSVMSACARAENWRKAAWASSVYLCGRLIA